MQSKDAVIVGAGIIGLSIAYQLASRGHGDILVLERADGLGEGSTGASSAVCRFKYSHDEMVQLARDGIGAYQNWADFLALRKPTARYHRAGMLWFDPDASRADVDLSRLRRLGVRASVLDDREVRERFPSLNTCMVAPDLITGVSHECREGGQHLLEADGGYVEPTDALQDLLTAARSRGVEVQFRSNVRDLTTASGRVTGVTLADGTHISSDTVVNAAGPWCNGLLATVGLDREWPLVPTRIQVAQVNLPDSVAGPIPVVGDLVAGIYFRPQGHRKHIIVGSVLPEDEREAVADPDQLDQTADDHFVRTKLHALQHRVPGLGDLRGVVGYSGLYTMNIADVHPVVGKTPITGLYIANGFSGHGFKLAPAIGSLVAQAITGHRVAQDTQVDLGFLSFDRTPISLEHQSVLA